MSNNIGVSWADPPYNDEDEYFALCENSKPSDFYFAAKDHSGCFGGITMIVLVPKDYFQQEHCMWDQSMDLKHILPDYFFESMESVWESDQSVYDVRKDLLTRGFIENDELSSMIAEDFD